MDGNLPLSLQDFPGRQDSEFSLAGELYIGTYAGCLVVAIFVDDNTFGEVGENTPPGDVGADAAGAGDDGSRIKSPERRYSLILDIHPKHLKSNSNQRLRVRRIGYASVL